MIRSLETIYWLLVCTLGISAAICGIIVMAHDSSPEIETSEHLNMIINEERQKLGISDKIKIIVKFDEKSIEYLNRIEAEAATNYSPIDKTYFTIYFRQPTTRFTVKHELSHIHNALILDWFTDSVTKRTLHEIFAYFYATTDIDLAYWFAQF